MCTNTKLLPSKSIYYSRYYSDNEVEVPCGKCEECRQSRRSEWSARLSYELDDLYKKGGLAVFLTFTYNDAHLPYYEDLDCNLRITCFRHEDVRNFLNRMKVFAYKKYGSGSFKYYFCSEYGKYTRRPHYHALFFLQPCIACDEANVIDFIEACRYRWQDKGFMFPKYNGSMYVDNEGKENSPLIRVLVAGAKYVSKYITKDMSYFGLPELSLYLEDYQHKEKMKEYLPKSFISKGLGYCLINGLDLSSDVKVKDILINGVLNPLTNKKIPLPRYCINKLMYKNVSTKDTVFERFGKDKKRALYDRLLTPFGKIYLRYVYKAKVKRTSERIQKLFVSVFEPSLYKRCMDLCNVLHINYNDVRTIDRFSIYHTFWSRKCNDTFQKFMIDNDGVIDSLFDIDKIADMYVLSKDNNYLRWSASTTKIGLSTFRQYFFPHYFELDALLKCISDDVHSNRCNSVKLHSDTVERVKYQNTYVFDKSLC